MVVFVFYFKDCLLKHTKVNYFLVITNDFCHYGLYKPVSQR